MADHAPAGDLDRFFEQMQKTAGQIGGQIAPLLDKIEPIREMLTAPGSAYKNLCECIDQARDVLQSSTSPGERGLEKPDHVMRALPALASTVDALGQYGSRLEEVVRGSVEPILDPLRETLRGLPERTREALLVMGEHGWYFELDMTPLALDAIKDELLAGDAKEAEEILAKYYRGRVDPIEDAIAEKFPNRAHLIQMAFRAHRRGEYALAIPVLLAQADGMCKEITTRNYFVRCDKQPGTARYVNEIEQAYLAALLWPLACVLPIGKSEKERGGEVVQLNRHRVLHGEALDYGTEINSLMVISFVNYVAEVLTLREESRH